MRKSTLVLVLVVALAALAQAQYTGSTSQSTTTATSAAAGESKSGAGKDNTLTGCLNGPDSQGMFTLNTTGKKKKAVSIDAGTVDLKPHAGHEVRVTGTWETMPAAAGATTAPSGEKEMKHFKVTNIEHVSDTCPAEGASKEATPKY